MGPQGRSGRAENLIPTGIRSRTVQLVAQSLYRLSYRAHYRIMYSYKIKRRSMYRFLGAQLFEAARISIKSAHERGKFMFTDRPPLPPRR